MLVVCSRGTISGALNVQLPISVSSIALASLALAYERASLQEPETICI